MAILDKINLDFQLLNSGDPEILVIYDTSVWGAIESKIAIVEITLPNRNQPNTYTFEKGKANVFNSSNLQVSNVGERTDLPDGIYRISLKGSPSTFCKQRDVIKTDRLQMKLDSLYLKLGTNNLDQKTKDLKLDLLNIELMIKASKSAVKVGELNMAYTYYNKAMETLDDFIECENCN